MDNIITLLSVVGAMLLAGACGFVLSGSWAPSAPELVVPEARSKPSFATNLAYLAILAPVGFMLLYLAR